MCTQNPWSSSGSTQNSSCPRRRWRHGELLRNVDGYPGCGHLLKVKRPSKAHERERQMDAQVMPRGSGRLLQVHT